FSERRRRECGESNAALRKAFSIDDVPFAASTWRRIRGDQFECAWCKRDRTLVGTHTDLICENANAERHRSIRCEWFLLNSRLHNARRDGGDQWLIVHLLATADRVIALAAHRDHRRTQQSFEVKLLHRYHLVIPVSRGTERRVTAA